MTRPCNITQHVSNRTVEGQLVNGTSASRPPDGDRISPFIETPSQREREVLALVAEGYSNKMIALSLDIAERTVKTHLTNILTKFGAADRTHAVVTAIRRGWLFV